jgi:class 3 adenylate cyclase
MQMNFEKLAVVLLDIIGSTQYVERVGALKAAQWLQYHDRLTRTLLYRFNGREIDRSDGFMLSFSNTIDAVNFALWYQITIPAKTQLQTRIGIHWGEIVEIKQLETFIRANAKSIELEGITKNIAARTMSVCSAGQVLVTEATFKLIKNQTNYYTPKGTRYSYVGLYEFKGVSVPQNLYALGLTIESLQPPKSSDKAYKLKGAHQIRSRYRDRKIKEWLRWLIPKLALISAAYLIYTLWPFLINREARALWGIKGLGWVDWVEYFREVIKRIILGQPL